MLKLHKWLLLSWQSFHICAGQVPTLPAEMWKLCQSIGWMVVGSKDAHNIPEIVHDPLVHCTDWQSFHLCAGHVSSLPAPMWKPGKSYQRVSWVLQYGPFLRCIAQMGDMMIGAASSTKHPGMVHSHSMHLHISTAADRHATIFDLTLPSREN